VIVSSGVDEQATVGESWCVLNKERRLHDHVITERSSRLCAMSYKLQELVECLQATQCPHGPVCPQSGPTASRNVELVPVVPDNEDVRKCVLRSPICRCQSRSSFNRQAKLFNAGMIKGHGGRRYDSSPSIRSGVSIASGANVIVSPTKTSSSELTLLILCAGSPLAFRP
jgi:hypothetical protein